MSGRISAAGWCVLRVRLSGSLDGTHGDGSRHLCGAQYFKDTGTKIGFGTDLLGNLEEDQCTEFKLRANIFSNFKILHKATAMNGEILGQKDRLIRTGVRFNNNPITADTSQGSLPDAFLIVLLSVLQLVEMGFLRLNYSEYIPDYTVARPV